MADNFNLRDAALEVTKALPAAGASAYTAGIDLGAVSARGKFAADCELVISLPATPDLVDDKTVIVDLECDSDVAFGSVRTLALEVLKVTGAGGAGAAAKEIRFRLPSDVEQYLRAKTTVLAGGGDNTGIDLTMGLAF